MQHCTSVQMKYSGFQLDCNYVVYEAMYHARRKTAARSRSLAETAADRMISLRAPQAGIVVDLGCKIIHPRTDVQAAGLQCQDKRFMRKQKNAAPFSQNYHQGTR